MVRRFFISAFPSVIALTASALDPAAAAATQNATVQTRMPSFPLPDVGDGVNFRDSDGVRIPTVSRRLAA
jgi:hypothetical protein